MNHWTWQEIVEQYQVVANGRTGSPFGNFAQAMVSLMELLESELPIEKVTVGLVLQTLTITVEHERRKIHIDWLEGNDYLVYVNDCNNKEFYGEKRVNIDLVSDVILGHFKHFVDVKC